MVEQLAQQYESKLRVVGMGTQDSFPQAEDFLERGGVSTPLMTWDESFKTWEHYEVRGQPVAILVDANGAQLGRWNGLSKEMIEIVESS